MTLKVGRRAPKCLCVGAGKKKTGYHWNNESEVIHILFPQISTVQERLKPQHGPTQAGGMHSLLYHTLGRLEFQALQSHPIFIFL